MKAIYLLAALVLFAAFGLFGRLLMTYSQPTKLRFKLGSFLENQAIKLVWFGFGFRFFLENFMQVFMSFGFEI